MITKVRLYRFLFIYEVTKFWINFTGTYLQHGEGSRPHFIIENKSTRHYRRFGFEGREIQGIIAPPLPNADICAWLEDCMRDLHRQLYSRGTPTNFIGITID